MPKSRSEHESTLAHIRIAVGSHLPVPHIPVVSTVRLNWVALGIVNWNVVHVDGCSSSDSDLISDELAMDRAPIAQTNASHTMHLIWS